MVDRSLRDLKAYTSETLPNADLEPLLAMEYAELVRTLMICRDIYHEGHALENGRGRPRRDRATMIREIIRLRSRFLRLTPAGRARQKVGTHADRFVVDSIVDSD